MARSAYHLYRSLGAYALGPAVGLLTAPLLSRALGVDGRGQLAALLQPLTMADALAAAGLPAAVTYYVAKGAHVRPLLRTVRRLQVLIVLPIAIFLSYYAYVLDARDVVSWSWTSIPWLCALAFGSLVSVRRAGWQGLGCFGRLDAERVAGPVLRLGMIGVAFAFGVSSAYGFLWLTLIAGWLGAATLFRSFPTTQPLSSPVPVRNLVSFGSRGALGVVFAFMAARLDQAILPLLVEPRALGAYAVAVTVAEVPAIVSWVVTRNLLTLASGGSTHELRLTLLFGIYGSGGLAGIIAVISPWAIPLLFGPDFAASVLAAQILCLGSWLATMVNALGAVLAGRGRPGAMSAIYGVAAITTVSLLVTLADDMTPMRAAVISVTSQLFALGAAVLAMLYIRRVSRGRSS